MKETTLEYLGRVESEEPAWSLYWDEVDEFRLQRSEGPPRCDSCIFFEGPHEWWVHVMPSRAFQMDGLVHMSVPRSTYAYCGAGGSPYGLDIRSTDAALVYARTLFAADEMVNCIVCIVNMEHDDDR